LSQPLELASKDPQCALEHIHYKLGAVDREHTNCLAAGPCSGQEAWPCFLRLGQHGRKRRERAGSDPLTDPACGCSQLQKEAQRHQRCARLQHCQRLLPQHARCHQDGASPMVLQRPWPWLAEPLLLTGNGALAADELHLACNSNSGTPIWECTNVYNCKQDCMTCVAQRSRMVALDIFKMLCLYGWAVRAMNNGPHVST